MSRGASPIPIRYPPRPEKPLWVKLIGPTLIVTCAVPVALSFVVPHQQHTLQKAAFVVGAAWLFACGSITMVNPMVIARWFARPGTYDVMSRAKDSAFTRWYLRIAGVLLMLVAVFVGALFWFT